MQATVQSTNGTLAVWKKDAAWKQNLARLMQAAPACDRSRNMNRFKLGSEMGGSMDEEPIEEGALATTPNMG